MTIYDVFNGDADGICALLQLRQIEPTGVCFGVWCKARYPVADARVMPSLRRSRQRLGYLPR